MMTARGGAWLFCIVAANVPSASALSMSRATGVSSLDERVAETAPPKVEAGTAPGPEVLEDGESYQVKVGEGCGQRPFNSLFADKDDTALSFKAMSEHWNGFCQMGWPLCPDAVAAKDYVYYAKGIGRPWVQEKADHDKNYCGLNGWLKPEIAAIVRNFTATKAKGEELCHSRYENDFYRTTNIELKLEKFGDVRKKPGAEKCASWNCAMGDLGCDLAYCNYWYCELEDGSFGTMEECNGFNMKRGNIEKNSKGPSKYTPELKAQA